jgi:EAL domain-containing protein (putative c-di-GMP-specific phosphodiesterase class I)
MNAHSDSQFSLAADACVRTWRENGRLDAVAVPVRGIEVDAQAGWYELQVCVGDGFDSEDVLGRGEELGIRHQLERTIIRQGLDWLGRAPEVRRLSLRVSQYSLLVPGVVDRLVRDVEASGIAPERLCMDILSLDKIQYFSHLSDVATRFRELGMRVVLDRLDDADTRRLFPVGLHFDYFRIRRRYTRGLSGDTTSRLAIDALNERLSGTRVRLLAECVDGEEQRQALANAGVAFYLRARDADAVHIGSEQGVSIEKKLA